MTGTPFSLQTLHARFLELLPSIETHGRIYFRYLRCPHQKDDAIQEMRALAWKWFLRLTHRGKNVGEFLTTFNTYLAHAVHSGRRLVGMEKARSVMCPQTQKRKGFTVESLPLTFRVKQDPHGQQAQDAFEEQLQDNTITPIPDQVQFRIDFPAWLKTLTGRERRIIKRMALNERTKDLSQQFDLSTGRISQLRQEFQLAWKHFCDEPSSK